MSADALHVRRARVAIYGPPTTAIVGGLLVLVGILGLTLGHDATTSAPGISSPAVTVPATTPVPRVVTSPKALAFPSSGTFVLAGTDGRLYAPANAGLEQATKTATATHIVGGATAANGGVWLLSRDGRVIGVRVDALGSLPLTTGAARAVAIAPSANGHGYRIVTADGHLRVFGASKLGGLAKVKLAAPVVGMSTAAHDGYWIALADGRVYAFGAPDRGRATLAPSSAPVVGIASSLDGRGYWLATADGHVYSFGVPGNGDPSRTRFSAPVVGIAAAPDDGYWLTTADGRVYGYGAPKLGPGAKITPGSKIAAIVPN